MYELRNDPWRGAAASGMGNDDTQPTGVSESDDENRHYFFPRLIPRTPECGPRLFLPVEVSMWTFRARPFPPPSLSVSFLSHQGKQ